MQLKILVPVAVCLLLLAIGVYWRVFGSFEKPRRALPVLQKEALSGKSPLDQLRAAVEITEYAGDPKTNAAAISVLRDVFRESRSPEVKAALLDGFRRADDWESLPLIFDSLADESAELRGRAAAAAREMLGADYGFAPNDPPKKRAAIIAEMHASYLRMSQNRSQNSP